jgi:hypothetical protein
MPAVPNRPDATDRRAARASPRRMGQLMSDDLIHAVRAWSSRFSPWQTSASTRFEPCNRAFWLRHTAFLAATLKRGNASVDSELRCIHAPPLSSYLCRHCPPSKTYVEVVCSGFSTSCGATGRAGRLSVVRQFLLHLSAFVPETEVPGGSLLARARRPKPFLFSTGELQQLLAAAGKLKPANALRPHTMQTVLGLLASTG